MKHLLLLLFVVITQPASGQHFNKVFDIDSSGDWGYDVFVNPDSTYFVIGGALFYSTYRWNIFGMTLSKDGSQVQVYKRYKTHRQNA